MMVGLMPIPLQPLALPDLFARLAEGHAARIAVLTPNARLAQALQSGFDRFQLGRGRSSWEAPDILPFPAFLARAHEEARFAAGGEALPVLLSPAESALLWEEAIRASRWHGRLLSVHAAAALAAEAWQVAHAWGIEGALDGADAGEDARAFAGWSAAYRKRLHRERLLDAALLPDAVAEGFARGAARAPALLVLHGFDLATPQQERFLAACAAAGAALARTERPRAPGVPRRALFASPREELEHAARWARARLESAGDGSPRIGVVVPQLAERRAEVSRIFSRVLGEGSAASEAPLFNLSLGAPLSSFPVVDAALDLIDLAAGPLPFERASRLLRSPFIGGAETERDARARLDEALRRLAPASLSLHRLRSLVPEAMSRRGGAPCPLLLARLDRLSAACGEESRADANEWARRFTACLDAAGFPGDRPLDSAEFQALAKWREALSAYAALGSVAPAWSGSEARARLRRLCNETTFQPASGEAPVQVLGILESAGLDFDHLWVSGLTEDAWPLAARPHPLIAPALQRRANIPNASAERSLEVDAALTDAWRAAAPEVLFTSARADGDRELLPSPLIAAIGATDVGALGIPEFATRRGALHAAGRTPGAVASRPEALAPALGASASVGGTAVLADQAACPFRAFAHFRLRARALEAPEPGLGPPERGQLLHAMMARLWSALGDQATLKATDDARLAALVEEAAAHAVARVRAERPGRLEGRFAELERERLARIAREWLEIEKARAPFEVRMREEKMTLSAGNLQLSGRVDRVDRLKEGGLAVIDYKSGPVSVSAWLGPRPDDAQLPLYALAAGDEEIRAVAFARLKIGQLGFAGLARDEGLLPGVETVRGHRTAKKVADSWDALLARWREELDTLGENYASGDARIDPKRGLATCQRCDLQTLCRVHERFCIPAGDDEEEEE
jgi:probable DNA repair protein